MGLSVMEDVPGSDQQLRFANIAGQMGYLPQNAWVGESNLMGLGLGEGPGGQSNDFQNNVGAATQGISSIIQSIAALKGNKSKNKGGQQRPAQQSPSNQIMSAPPAGSGGGIPTWLIYGGVALVGVAVLYLVLKKKKTGADKEA